MSRILLISILTVVAFSSHASDGFTKVASVYSAEQTMNHFEQALLAKGMTVFSRIDHARGAANIGAVLRPTEVIIFGNPKIGSKLMQCSQAIAIDLPLKALVFQDETGQVWLAYNDPYYLAERHALTACQGVLEKMSKALANFAKVISK